MGGNGYNFAGGHYATKGCYAFASDKYADMIFFGTGGTLDEMKKTPPKPQYRPEGYDCPTKGK